MDLVTGFLSIVVGATEREGQRQNHLWLSWDDHEKGTDLLW
jgi:hypothetical protein